MTYATANDSSLRSKVGEKIRSFYYDSSVISNSKKFYNNLKFIIMYGNADDVAWALQVMYKGIVGLIGDRSFNDRVVERIKNDEDIDKIVKKIKDILTESENFYYVYIFLVILRKIVDGKFLDDHFKKHNEDCNNLYKQCPILQALKCIYDVWEGEDGWNKLRKIEKDIISRIYSFCYTKGFHKEEIKSENILWDILKEIPCKPEE